MGGSEAVILDGEGLRNGSSPNRKHVPRNIQMEDNDKISIDPLMSVGSDEFSEGGSNSNSISNQMKRMVQTNYAQPPKSPEHMVHRATATGTGDVNSSPLRTDEPLRYSLGSTSTYKKHDHRHSEEGHRRASDGMVGATSKTKLQAAHNLALKSTSTGEQKRVSDTQLISSRSSSSSSCRPKDPNAYKIFLLLLQPKSKIFELIQLIYSPNDTTLGDILKMIPDNATEHALGAQEYLGLCRPKGEEELLDKNLLASEPTLAGASGDTEGANITLGEILVAIPQGYTGSDVAALSKQILTNPKIVKLLKRSDPLAPKKRRSSRSHRHSSGTSSSRRGSSRRKLEILNKLDEEEEVNQEQKMKQAMEHATTEAAAANAAIRGGSMVKIKRSDSMQSGSERSIGNMSMQESLDESYSSWSKSFENSFSTQSSICGGVSRRAMRRKERQVRRMIVLKRAGAAAFSLMIGVYFIDPRGYAEQIDEVTDSPMGLAGIFQCFFLLLTLYKMERFFRIDNIDNGEQIRRCPFLKASANAMDQLKTRYSNKLKQKPSKSRRNSVGEESLPSSPHRLRSFSLKADRSSDDDQDSTGSL
jgi:hypothetical protein